MSIFLEFLKLFLTFFRIGAFTFGGGYAMLPLIQDAVLQNKWLSEEAIVNFIAVSESTPGPFAINIATYVGMERGRALLDLPGGFLGAAVATLGVVLPSFIVILIVARVYKKFQESKTVKGCMNGLRPTVIGLIAAAVLNIGTTVFFPDGFSLSALNPYNIVVSLVIAVIGILLIFKKKIHPIILILISAALGIAAGFAGELIR
ncbi:MAG: chromate transporter [Clostridia bacterium]|nr:chromate transporter [Clostridia bacterium]